MSFDIPNDWPYHGRPSGYRYGCRCHDCKAAHLREQAQTRHRSMHGDHRTCKRCFKAYDRRTQPDAGTKYCGDCRRTGVAYDPFATKAERKPKACPICNTIHSRTNRWLICHSCEQLLPEHIWRSLKTHHADEKWVRKALNAPACQICETDLTKLRRTANGNYKSSFCVDHDHTCCPKESSCGSCIRGFLCHACNAGIGYLKDDPQTIARALTYVESTK